MFYVSQRCIQDKIRYKIKTKVLIEFIDYCHFNAAPVNARFTRIACGSTIDKFYYYYTIIDDNENAVLTAAAEVEHTAFKKTAFEMVKECTVRKEPAYMSMTSDTLMQNQKMIHQYWKDYVTDDTNLADSTSSFSYLSDITYSEENDSGQDTTIAAPKSQRERIIAERLKEHHSPVKEKPVSKLPEVTPTVSAPVVPTPVVVVPVVEPEKIVTIDASLIDPELKDIIDQDPIVSSLMEPEGNNRNSDYIPRDQFIAAENNVLVDRLSSLISEHHEKKSESISNNYSSAHNINDSVLRKLNREENRYNASVS